MKHISLLFLTLLALDLHAQTGLDQKTLLAQFEGNWTTEQGDQHLKMSAGSYLDGLGMTIVVYRIEGQDSVQIARELIGYDKGINQLLSLGILREGPVYKGKGQFSSSNRLVMRNIDSHNTLFNNTEFLFSDQQLEIRTRRPGQLSWNKTIWVRED